MNSINIEWSNAGTLCEQFDWRASKTLSGVYKFEKLWYVCIYVWSTI